MSRQISVSSIDKNGKFVTLSSVSHGASGAGLNRSDVIGRRAADFTGDEERDEFRRLLSECLIEGEPQEFFSRTSVGGHVEHWHTTLEACHGAEVIMVGREIIPPSLVVLTEPEKQLLTLLIQDRSIEEIAEFLESSPAAISSRLIRLRGKVGCRTTHGLVAWAVRFDMTR